MSRRAKRTSLVDAPNPRKRAVIYKRASTNESNQPHSLKTQDVEGRRFVEREDWELVGVYEEYASGKDQNRRKLQELLRDARAGLFDIVVFQRIDRLARSLLDLLDIMKQFDEAGVAFYSVHERFESETVSGRLLIQVIGALAEFERRLLLERIHGGQRTKVIEKGLPLSRSRAPFGTRVDDATGMLERDLVTDEEGVVVGGTWPLVQAVFDDYAIRGLSPKSIAKKLTGKGHRTSNGNEWSRQAVHDILHNRTYVGELWWNGEWYPGAHSAFLDTELFDRAQTILEQNAAEGAARVAQAGQTDYLLSGLFRCHSCDASMVGTSANARGRRYRYYYCSRAVKSRPGLAALTRFAYPRTAWNSWLSMWCSRSSVRTTSGCGPSRSTARGSRKRARRPSCSSRRCDRSSTRSAAFSLATSGTMRARS
ncbi:recombinase family protein [Blastococcus sp. HT6-30]|uniref:recombinase family protein n=1 Tax=Blastococcus sp. HT6-30 TaxID=3144843 RepID=UPI00321BC3CB